MLSDASASRPGPAVRLATLDEVLPLRALVLRDGARRESAWYPGDDDALHRVVAAPGVVACATGMVEALDGTAGWRVRGVAVHPRHRGSGLGAAVVAAVLDEAPDALWWCTARVAVAGFWQRMGFVIASPEPFALPHGGLHHRMVRPRA